MTITLAEGAPALRSAPVSGDVSPTAEALARVVRELPGGGEARHGQVDMAEAVAGAIASGDIRVLNEDVVKGLRIPTDVIERLAAREQQELERRERLYRGDRPFPEVRGKTVQAKAIAHTITFDDPKKTKRTAVG